MYLFQLNKRQEIDSTHAGNKTRFINHSNDEHANIVPRVTLCNSVWRIGLYALKDLACGVELFFDYNYPEEATKDFQQPKQKEVPGKVFAAKVSREVERGKLPTSARRVLAQNAKAAKAAKGAELLDLEITRRTVEKARKTISASKTDRPGRRGSAGRENSEEGSQYDPTHSSSVNREIQETDPEDNLSGEDNNPSDADVGSSDGSESSEAEEDGTLMSSYATRSRELPEPSRLILRARKRKRRVDETDDEDN